ncbi:bifunctional 4-hydroxy-2-oxoglutarate aldolase/2-dehydro-3-deoxy-phosphogluconate aldolase [Anaerotignum sp.]|uniref:bifunctional 4-hydroxy-2-oxoglutarate aldolase/2-dehydro-3-deoxy-phosphogluconate aldolase n=1 Tax=Anaerotignum sp. TaxID=2039241 RepID=UPI002ED13604
MTIAERISKIGVVPVIKLERPEEDALPLAKALSEGGLPVAEITFRAEGADKAIKLMRDNYPDMIVGAGTVLYKEQVDRALAAGAQFIVSPGFNPKIVAYCIEKNVPIFPGCVTPTEIEAAHDLGLTTFKFFPAQQYGGLATIKALSGPYHQFMFMPTGGISLDNLKEYLSFKNICAVGGSFMVTDKLINGKEWDEITTICRKAADIVAEVRN